MWLIIPDKNPGFASMGIDYGKAHLPPYVPPVPGAPWSAPCKPIRGGPRHGEGLHGLGQVSDERKEALIDAVENLEENWAIHQQAPYAMPSSFLESQMQWMRAALTTERWPAGGFWPFTTPSSSELLERVNRIDRLLIQRETPERIGPGVLTKTGAVFQASPTKAEYESLEQDAEAAAKAAAEWLRKKREEITKSPWTTAAKIAAVAAGGVLLYNLAKTAGQRAAGRKSNPHKRRRRRRRR